MSPDKYAFEFGLRNFRGLGLKTTKHNIPLPRFLCLPSRALRRLGKGIRAGESQGLGIEYDKVQYSFPQIPLPSIPLPSIPLPSIPLPSIPLPAIPLPAIPLPSPIPLPAIPLPRFLCQPFPCPDSFASHSFALCRHLRRVVDQRARVTRSRDRLLRVSLPGHRLEYDRVG